MTPTLLLGKEALVRGAARDGASLFASPSLSAAGVDPGLVERLSAEGGAATETDGEDGMARAIEAAQGGKLGVAALEGSDLAAAGKFFAMASRMGAPVLFLVVGAPGEGPPGVQSASQRELAALRWAGDGALWVHVPASAGECYVEARLAAGRALRRSAPAVLYVDHVVAHLREPVEIESDGAPADFGGRIPDDAWPGAELYRTRDAVILVVAVGIVARAARTAVRAARERGIRAGLLRPVRLWPFCEGELVEAAARARRVIVAELTGGGAWDPGAMWEPIAARLQMMGQLPAPPTLLGKRRPPVVLRIADLEKTGRIPAERILEAILHGER